MERERWCILAEDKVWHAVLGHFDPRELGDVTQKLCDQNLTHYSAVSDSTPPECPNCLKIEHLEVEFSRPTKETEDGSADDSE